MQRPYKWLATKALMTGQPFLRSQSHPRKPDNDSKTIIPGTISDHRATSIASAMQFAKVNTQAGMTDPAPAWR